jgi:glycerophosphoryl diester phosphodiesterase
LAAALHAQQPTFPLTALRDRPLVCSHRGRLTANDIENSVSVMRHTFAQGVPMMEFDPRETSDRVMYLSHDAKLDRVTTGSGLVSAHTSADMAKVMLRDPATGTPVEPIPRFDDLLAFAKEKPVALMVDLKDTQPADAVAALKRYGVEDHALLLTFDPATTAASLAADPKVLVSILVKTPQEIDDALAAAKGHPIAFYLASSADPALFAYAHSKGRPIISDAMNDLDLRARKTGPAVYREFLSTHHVDILVTDRALELTAAISAGK